VDEDDDLYPVLTSRNVHLVAPVSSAFAEGTIVPEALLLDDDLFGRPDKL
jgi:hypothetical protein